MWFARAVAAVALALVPLLGVAQPVQAAGPPVVDPFNETAEQFNARMQQRAYALRVPGSTAIAASRGQTSARTVAGLRRHVAQSAANPGTVHLPTSTKGGRAPKFGVKALTGASNAVAAAYGVDLVYSQAAGAFEYWGMAGGYESEGLLCDISRLAYMQGACAIGPGTEYLPNADALKHQNGWLGGVSTSNTTPNAQGHAIGQVFAGVIDSDVTRRTTGQWSGSCPDMSPNGYSMSASLRLFVYAINGGAWKQRASGTVGLSQCNTQGGGLGSGLAGLDLNVSAVAPLPSTQFIVSTVAIPSATTFATPQLLDAALRTTATPFGEQRLIYYSKNLTALRPPDVSEDPLRWWTTTWKCDAGAPQSVDSATWSELEEFWPEPPEPSCDGGSVSYIKVTQSTTGLDPYTLYEWEMDPGVSGFPGQYPECTDGSCTLELHRKDSTTGTRLACFDMPEACIGWFESPTKVDQYVCTYGTHDLALDECNAYAGIFDYKNRQPGGAYADPATGALPGGTTPPPPAPSTGCPPPFEFTLGGMGYWVTKGTTCALEAAFVPKTTAWPNLGEKSPIPEVRSAVEGLEQFTDPAGQACIVLGFDAPLNWGHVEVLDSCGDDPFVNWLRAHRGLLSAAVWISSAAGLAGWAWRTYAPGSGGAA